MTRVGALLLSGVLLGGCGSLLLHESHYRHICLQESMQVGSFMDAVGRRKLFQSCMAARNWKEVGNEGW